VDTLDVQDNGAIPVSEPPVGDALPASDSQHGEVAIKGTVLSFGMVVGDSLFFKIPPTSNLFSSNPVDVSEEQNKIKQGLERLRNSASEIVSEVAVMLTEESLEVFDVYRLLAQDSTFEKELLDIVTSGKTAYEATEVVAQNFRKRMRSNSFWQTRLYDMLYLLRQLRNFIQNVDEQKVVRNVDRKPIILIASYISPADLLHHYRYRNVVGLVLKDASPNSHAAIVARSLQIPTIGGIFLSQKTYPNPVPLLLDANCETLYIRPTSSTLEHFHRRTVLPLGKADNLPMQAVTKDHVKIELYINANLDADIKFVHHPIVNGVGLFRTEILFMLPDVAADFYAQVEEYKKIFNKAGEKPVIFRTIDMADDKESPVFAKDQKEIKIKNEQWGQGHYIAEYANHLVLPTPMGKALLNRHQFLRTQVKALLRARVKSNMPFDTINIMIPMISDAVELKAYQKIIESEALQEAKNHPSLMSQIKIGVMIEVPSLAFQINRFHTLVDFVSIGTNDLFHFFFATNRWDARHRRPHDVLAPTFLHFMGNIVHQFVQAGVPVHVCGEMAATPLTAMALLGLGVRRLSVAPVAVWGVANMINSLAINTLYPYTRSFRLEPYEFCVREVTQYENSADVRHTLQKFANENGVVI
jgi:phosphotransferase system enzyme I (PtsP)